MLLDKLIYFLPYRKFKLLQSQILCSKNTAFFLEAELIVT